MNFKKLLIASLLFILTTTVGWGQINISAGNTITQNFTIGTSATATLPTGWKMDKNTTVRSIGSYTSAVTATEQRAGNSMSTSAANGIYNFAAGDPAVATDRAVGGLSSSSSSKSVNTYVQLYNNGLTSINDFTISYNVEKYRNGSNAAGFSIQMYYSTNGTSWTSAGSNFLTSFTADADNNGFTAAPGSTVSISSKTLSVSLAASSSLYLAWNYSVTSGTTTSNAQALGIDDVSITANGSSLTPTITALPSSFTGFSYVEGGGPSVEQSFVLSGTNLNGTDVILTAPTHFEISTDNISFSGTHTFTSYNGADQTVYVRLKAGLSAGTYAGENITISGGGDVDGASVSCSGTVTPLTISFSITAASVSENGISYTIQVVSNTIGLHAADRECLNNCVKNKFITFIILTQS